MSSEKKLKKTRSIEPLTLPVVAQEHSPDTMFPIVGIGASAGGLAAFEAFFSGMPADSDPGMAFVLVQHLAPDHKSILSELVRRYTRMQVFEVEDGIVVQVNCVYIILPNHDMAFLNGALHLLEPSAPRGLRLPINFFFRSLAQDQHECAIGIVLSGTGSDGTLGIRAIKDEGGMVMAQNPASTEFDGMPSSAIATGLVDYELPPEKMAAQLIAYAAHAFGKPHPSVIKAAPKTEGAVKKIFILLRTQTGHDFSQYKPSTIYRRIERRMAVNQIEGIENYLKYLQQTPTEVDSLFRDLLIGVTNFFRDPEAFKILEDEIIPKLFADKQAGGVIRVWSIGCSTGEEAYSIAILLQEHMESLKQNFTLQVFATDIDSRAIAAARAGLYPASIVADITPERLSRFFTVVQDGNAYRIKKGLRDMLIFSEQNIIKDPPFSRLDLISCRNLLIYFDSDLQKKIIPLFKYALKPGGFLLLGTSEGIGEFVETFAVLDRKVKLFQRKEDFLGVTPEVPGRFIPSTKATEAVNAAKMRPAAKTEDQAKMPLREMTEQALLQQVAPAAALVNAQGDILYLHGRTGMYLEPSPGETGISNILKMAREGLRPDLTMALHKAVRGKENVHCNGLNVKTNSHFTRVNMTIRPVITSESTEEQHYLVILEETPAIDAPSAQPTDSPSMQMTGAPSMHPTGASDHNTHSHHSDKDIVSLAEARIEALTDELRAKDEYLQTTQEQLESSNEELKSSNEEMQSVNEELQSTNEELETSKEELQSVNEELATVNAELQTKVVDLSRSNNDMNNLLAGTGIGTVFVDHQLRILRFTPAASTIINLINSDVGRPVAHIASNLIGYDRLVADTQAVLNTLVLKEVDVQSMEGKWYTMRIQPYRTLDNVIEGVVISFVDVTEVVQTRDALKKANELMRLAVVVRDAHDAIAVQDLNGRILAWNPSAVRIYGWSESEALLMNVQDRIPVGQQKEALSKLHQLKDAEILEPYRTQRITKDGSVLDVWMTATALLNEAGLMYAIATTERVVSGGPR